MAQRLLFKICQNARDLIAQCKMIDGHMGGMIMLDKELGARQYHTPSPLK